VFRKINKTTVPNLLPSVTSFVECKLGADFNLKDIEVNLCDTMRNQICKHIVKRLCSLDASLIFEIVEKNTQGK